jgi:hypothetical protein
MTDAAPQAPGPIIRDRADRVDAATDDLSVRAAA